MQPNHKELSHSYHLLAEFVTNEEFKIDLLSIDLVLSDPYLSWTAKGLYFYLGVRFKGRSFSIQDLNESINDNSKNIEYGLKLLEDHGYVTKIPKLSKNGKLDEFYYTVEKETNEIIPS